MAEEKEKTTQQDPEPKTPAGPKKEGLSEEDLKKVAGGAMVDFKTQ
jgi:hypothetical protein